MITYKVELTGRTALLQHKLPEVQFLKLLTGKKEKKSKTVETEETPRSIAEDHAYINPDGTCYIPTAMVKGAFIASAGEYKQTKGRKSFRAIAGGIFSTLEESVLIINPETNEVYTKDKFEIDIKRANNRNSGKSCAVIVCRPRFDKWRVSMSVGIDNDLISPDMVLEILEDAGRRVGIGSFRVSNGGSYGQFSVTSFQKID